VSQQRAPHRDRAIHARANERLEAAGLAPIAHLTPQTLRRTFASILGVCRVDTRRAVALLGHTDARMTLGVYAQLRAARATSPARSLRPRIRGVPRRAIPNHFRTGLAASPAFRCGRMSLTRERPASAGLSEERMKGLEPSTFCMAKRG
jgi:hypothetical protein